MQLIRPQRHMKLRTAVEVITAVAVEVITAVAVVAMEVITVRVRSRNF